MSRTLVLARGGHTWTFRCDAGDEDVLDGTLDELASSGACPLDSTDAAIVRRHFAAGLTIGLNKLAPESDEGDGRTSRGQGVQ
ncbi:MAG: hypothetical protein KDA28_02465 [Phycisphaerales bacterium]|nr:hypothetical protein [Phycisphaerales bacterium]